MRSVNLLGDQIRRLTRFSGGGFGGGNRNRYRVRNRPDRRAIFDLHLVHGDLRGSVINLNTQIVVVDAHVLIGVVGRALDQDGMRAATTRGEIRDAAVFVALVIVHVAAEDDETRAGALLAVFERQADAGGFCDALKAKDRDCLVR